MNDKQLIKGLAKQGLTLEHAVHTHDGLPVLATARSKEGAIYFIDAFGRKYYGTVVTKGEKLDMSELGITYKGVPLTRDPSNDLNL